MKSIIKKPLRYFTFGRWGPNSLQSIEDILIWTSYVSSAQRLHRARGCHSSQCGYPESRDHVMRCMPQGVENEEPKVDS